MMTVEPTFEEAPMPATRDRDTLVLRAPDRRSPAELVALAARELARRPAATRWDVHLAVEDRALAMFQANYPAAYERAHPAVWWTVAHGHAHPGQPGRHPCAWCMARDYCKQQQGRGLPALRVDQLGRLALGDPCPEKCQAALGWRPPAPPRPKPKPRPRSHAGSARSRPGTNRTQAARTSTSTRPSRLRLSPAELADVTRDGLTAAAGGPSRAQQDYSLARARALQLPPGSYEHLTGGRT
jgi:hypothetical protein